MNNKMIAKELMKAAQIVMSVPSEGTEKEADPYTTLLKKAYADEMTATLQYQMAAHQARGAGYCDVIPEYEEHMKEEFEHAEKILSRMEQLGAVLALNYSEIQCAGNPWVPIKTSDIREQLEILIKAETAAVEFYQEIVNQARESQDYVTERLFKELMADEEKHRVDLLRIYEGLE